jgi:hypothetical protein
MHQRLTPLGNENRRTSRVMTTTTSRAVSMISSDYILNPMIDMRRRW